ncbi:MAG: hypothetical protein AAGJ31_09445, partial [Verrucomicrobiota bacterium]
IGPDRLALCIRKGEVWFLDHVQSDAASEIRYHLFASGLHEPLGLTKDGDDLLVAQRGEITRLQDRNNDGTADAYLTACDGWSVTGSYHAYTYGPERDGNDQLWVTLNLDMGDFSDNSQGWRGWGGIVGEDGQFQPLASGMRSPCGLGANATGDMFFTDQQGTWIPATPLYHLRPHVFFGNQEGLGSHQSPEAPFHLSTLPIPNQSYPDALRSVPEFVPPAVWLPYNKMGRSATDIELIPEGSDFGPFEGQLLVGEFTNAAISRVFLEKVGGEYQGACFPFLDAFPAAVLRLCFAPDGTLFVGMSNRGWSSLGNRSYGLQRVRYTGEPLFAIQKVEAKPDGFLLTFTEPAAHTSATFQVSSFTYEYSSRYGGEEKDTQRHQITHQNWSSDKRSVLLRIDALRELYVYEISCKALQSRTGNPLSHPTAWYTLNHIP